MNWQTSLVQYWLVCITSLVPLFVVVNSARIRPVGEDEAAVKALSQKSNIPPGLSIENLQLGDTSSRRGRTTQSPLFLKTTTTTLATPAGPVVDESEAVLYRLINNDGRACILLLTDAIIQFNYVNTFKEKIEKDLFVPEKYEAAGSCDSGDDVKFTITWKNFAWTIFFSKTPGGDHWYIEKMTLDADTSDKHLEHIQSQASVLHFETKNQGGMLFPTPVGKSYACNEELSVVLSDGEITATVLLRKLKMQPFIFKNDFGPEHVCSPGGAKSYRDETAPVAVGSTLAVVSILTVAGYGAYRYMKVKKVQYDTME